MKFLTIFALALATVTAANLPEEELKSRNVFLPAGRPEGRITNGQTASDGQFPYQVGLSLQTSNGGLSFCGGSLLSNTKVLTAAHCADGIVKGWAYLGSNRRRSAGVVQQFTSKDIIVHSDWKDNILLNDIAIITIPYTRYTSNIQAVKLPASESSYSTYSGEEVIASGWGRYSDTSGALASTLQYAYRTVIPNNVCASYYGSVVSPSNICIATDGGISTCPGDSGGPLVLASTKVQVGVTSFGAQQGCEKGLPTAFTRITKYLDWIKKNAGI